MCDLLKRRKRGRWIICTVTAPAIGNGCGRMRFSRPRILIVSLPRSVPDPPGGRNLAFIHGRLIEDGIKGLELLRTEGIENGQVTLR